MPQKYLFQINSTVNRILPGILAPVLLFPIMSWGEDKSTLLQTEENNRKEIDWSKPVVSRGFGYEATSESDEAFEAQYKQAQIAYFFSDYEKARKIWQALSDQNHAQSQTSLAWLYHTGLGVDADLKRAYALYTSAIKQNNAIAQNNLGTMYENGQHVEKDLSKALSLYQQSAKNGYRFGQYNYANALLAGWVADTDVEAAKIWYRKAADQGVKQAQEKLQSMEE